MADTTNKPKLQLRSGIAVTSDKTPSPATKLLINHGKPNFTIQKSPKAEENGSTDPLSALQSNKNNNYNPYRSANGSTTTTSNTLLSTKFNGVFNTSNVTVTEKIVTTTTTTENEASKVVLRRTVREPEPSLREDEDETVPEFIRRQRRIQERLAKENVLDFDTRRSGYFTHVVISPTATTSRTSFIETMASPAIVPSLEIPPPKIEEEEVAHHATNGIATHDAHIGEEEEVARAIEEVNKAVADEEDDHPTEVVHAVVTSAAFVEEEDEEPSIPVAAVRAATQETEVTISHTNGAATLQHATGALIVNSDNGHEFTGTDNVEVVHATPAIAVLKNGTDISSLNATEHASGALVSNAGEAAVVASTVVQHSSGVLAINGADGEPEDKAVTVQVVHVAESKPLELQNGIEASSIQAASHASGALVLDEVSAADAELQAMAKLKFDIKAEGGENVEVTPVLRTE